jgi:ATP-binding cassette, subfamily B, heavy metal transporter
MSEKPDKIDFKYNFKLYWELLRQYKLLFAGLLVVILLVEASLLLDKLLFKVIVDNGTLYVDGNLTQASFLSILYVVALVFAGIIIARAFFKWVHLHMINLLDAGLIVDLKEKFFNHLLELSHHFHTSHRTGSLISRLIRGAGAIERMTDVLVFNAAPLVFQLVVVSFTLIFFDAWAALIVFGTVVVFVTFSLIIQKKQQPANLQYNNTEDFEKGNIADYFTNIDSIKYFGKEKAIQQQYKKLATDTKHAAMYNWGFYRWMDAGQTTILSLGTLILVWYTVVGLLNHTISVGTFVFIYSAYGGLVSPMFGFIHGARGFYTAMGDFESLFQYAKIENEVKDLPNAKALVIKKGKIEFKNLTFKYGERGIFQNFNLTIKPYTKVALVGHSGSGKTTLVKLLYRLYDLEKGKIMIDDIPINKIKQESLRNELSIVPQECVLFDDTIYNNIAFSNPHASSEDIWNAIAFAQLDKIIQKMPLKENTIVGERGVKLSGGEKQRVSIARAILANKKILVLDEATSSLDSKTEHDIQQDLKRLMKGRTSIIIAHRLSTIMTADIIVVLDNGKISQIGKHKQLIKKKGLYKELWNLQKGGYLAKEI